MNSSSMMVIIAAKVIYFVLGRTEEIAQGKLAQGNRSMILIGG